MSKSIKDLIKVATGKKDVEEGQLYNPDIPDERVEITDQYHKIYKTPKTASNGEFSLGQRRIFQDSRREAFSLDGAIDPNTIRAQVDPDNAMATLAPQALFSLVPSNVKKPKSQVNLIKLAHQSEANYRNRFMPKEDVVPQSESLLNQSDINMRKQQQFRRIRT